MPSVTKATKQPLEIPWDRITPYTLSLVCDISSPPAMSDYFAVFMAVGKQGTHIMFPMSRS